MALAVGALVFAVAAPHEAARAQDLGPTVDLRVGQEVTFPVTIADGRVALGPKRVSKPGAAQPKDGEIPVSVVKRGRGPMPI